MGGSRWEDDVARLGAIRDGHPSCSLILDANCGYAAEEALHVLATLHGEDGWAGPRSQIPARRMGGWGGEESRVFVGIEG